MDPPVAVEALAGFVEMPEFLIFGAHPKMEIMAGKGVVFDSPTKDHCFGGGFAGLSNSKGFLGDIDTESVDEASFLEEREEKLRGVGLPGDAVGNVELSRTPGGGSRGAHFGLGVGLKLLHAGLLQERVIGVRAGPEFGLLGSGGLGSSFQGSRFGGSGLFAPLIPGGGIGAGGSEKRDGEEGNQRTDHGEDLFKKGQGWIDKR